jgi:hypothetical protein
MAILIRDIEHGGKSRERPQHDAAGRSRSFSRWYDRNTANDATPAEEKRVSLQPKPMTSLEDTVLLSSVDHEVPRSEVLRSNPYQKNALKLRPEDKDQAHQYLFDFMSAPLPTDKRL